MGALRSSPGNLPLGSDTHRILFLILISLLVKAVITYNVAVINHDGVRYANSAYHLLRGEVAAAFGHEKMLFYSLTLGIFHWFIQDWFWAGKVLSSVFLTLTLIPLYLLTRELFSRTAALWSGLVFILLPSVNSMTGEVIKDAPFLFFILCALLLGIKALKIPRPGYFLLTFCCASAAALFRLEGLVFILAFSPAWALVLVMAEERRKYIRGLAAFLAVPAVAVILFGVLLLTGVISVEGLRVAWEPFARHYFDFDFLRNYHQIYDYLKTIEGKFPGGEWGQDFFEIARRNMAWVYLWGMFLKFFKEMFPIFLIPLVFGLATRDHDWIGLGVLLWLSFSYLAMNYYFIISSNFIAGRYLMAAVLFCLPIIGSGLARISLWCHRLAYARAAWIFILLLFVAYPAAKSFADSIESNEEIRACGLWLRNNMDLEYKKVITTDERVLFHAGLLRNQYEFLADGDREKLAQAAREKKPDVIVLTVSSDNSSTPKFVNYHPVKEFPGKKRSALVLARTE